MRILAGIMVALALVVASPAVARAEDGVHLTRALKLIEELDYEGALGELEAALASGASNAYELRLPAEAVAPPVERRPRAVRPVPDCGGQDGRETPSQYIPSIFTALDEATKARLDAIKAARTAQRNQE